MVPKIGMCNEHICIYLRRDSFSDLFFIFVIGGFVHVFVMAAPQLGQV